MPVIHFHKQPTHSPYSLGTLQASIANAQDEKVEFTMETELCYNIGLSSSIDVENITRICWLLSESFMGEGCLSKETWLKEEVKSNCNQDFFILEFGPRLNFATPFSTNAVSICHSIGISNVRRVEMSRRYKICVNTPGHGIGLTHHAFQSFKESVIDILHDRVTEMQYKERLTSFDVVVSPEQVYAVDVLSVGKKALEKVNKELGLALDEWDLEYYTELFKNTLHRNPTNVECFDLGQSNSEHSRHWFFKGKMIVDGKVKEKSLMDLVTSTQQFSNDNNVIKFSDNSSSIEGSEVETLLPQKPSSVSSFVKTKKKRHLLFTAETHNFPTGVAPFPGASTGTGGRIRDTHAAGRGSHVIAASAGYCFGNLRIPGYHLSWEDENAVYPYQFASPLDVAIQASNGASDYGNKFGEPVICGFARSFGMNNTVNGERREWIKPIMFSGGIGCIDNEHVTKTRPQKGMKVVKIGGPVYRIGVGGGAASSIQVQGDNTKELDFGAVQRGDPEMEQKLHRLIRACVEMGDENPICSIHDQGAGGNGNVLKEICDPCGAIIDADMFQLGDPTLSLLEIWGAEYQESDAILIQKKDVQLLEEISRREKVPVSFVGDITDDGFIRFKGHSDKTCKEPLVGVDKCNNEYVVDLPLDVVLGKMPQKIYNLQTVESCVPPLKLLPSVDVEHALDRVLRLPAVASKRYLTNKVDRSVTGLVAQQQCVGPLGTPVADVAVIALSHFDIVGGATAIGEQPIKCMIDPCKGARLTVAEALTNLVFAQITEIKDVKCSANWMWPAKSHGEGVNLYNACEAMSTMLSSLGVAVDGGKDSLGMAARVNEEVVKAPGALVISVYAPCTDIRKTITPDLKRAGNVLVYVKMTGGREWRLGGSALAQVYNQLGNNCPDVDDVEYFSRCFCTVQKLIRDDRLESGHDVSDGGLVTTLLEMSFAGNLGLTVKLDDLFMCDSQWSVLQVLFSEEPGVVLEVDENQLDLVMHEFCKNGITAQAIGQVTRYCDVTLEAYDTMILNESLVSLRSTWEATSVQLERLQCNPVCVAEEAQFLETTQSPLWNIQFVPAACKGMNMCTTPEDICLHLSTTTDDLRPQLSTTLDSLRPRVAVLREEGSNGDREMVACLHMVGFDVYDVTMHDLCSGDVDLSDFRGVVFVGGFSYGDVFGSAKGWAALAKFNHTASQQLQQFRVRPNTFSLGVCNGCQLMTLLGWVGSACTQEDRRDRVKKNRREGNVLFSHNVSGRFESRFVHVKVLESPAIMLKGMEDLCAGIWIAHGEGRLLFKNEGVLKGLLDSELAPIRYVDFNNCPTEKYPLNPNGAVQGIAALCSSDGRHLAMMPHPERSVLNWQLPWKPSSYNEDNGVTPWLQMFHNAYTWCVQQ